MSYPGPAPTAAELRCPEEVPVMIGSWAAVAVLLVLLGAIFQIIIPLAIAVATIGATLYFTAVSRKADAIQVGPSQFPHLHQAAAAAAARLGLPLPEVYINQSPFIGADAADVGNKTGVVTLTTALVDGFTPAEAQFVLARQFGHIKCRHTTWRILHGNSAGGMLGAVGQLFRTALQIVFSWWNRTMELTADRAGLIGGQDVRAGITAILKEMVGPEIFDRLDIPALLEQMTELEGNAMSAIAQAVDMGGKPFALGRIRELIRFYKSAQYQSLAARQGKAGTTMLSGGQGLSTGQLYQVLAQQAATQRAGAAAPGTPPPAPAAAPAAPLCRRCGQPQRPGARFCGACGAPQA